MTGVKSTVMAMAVATVAIAASIAAPPARGAMLAVALGGRPAYHLLNEPNVRLLGAGRIEGSLIIDAEFGQLWAVALRNRILLVNGSARYCSGRTFS